MYVPDVISNIICYIINKKNSACCWILDMRDFHTVPLCSGFCGFSGVFSSHISNMLFFKRSSPVSNFERGLWRGECWDYFANPSPRRTPIGRSIYSARNILWVLQCQLQSHFEARRPTCQFPVVVLALLSLAHSSVKTSVMTNKTLRKPR